MPTTIWQLVEREVHKQLHCQREGCGHFIWEHEPKSAEKMPDWSNCNHYGCNCFLAVVKL